MLRTYTDLIKLSTFEDRYNYLKLSGSVGVETFGYDRYLNQIFYRDKAWQDIRSKIIIRDRGCDLGIEGREIHRNLLIHHMNPITKDDLIHRSDYLLNPEYLITTSLGTHNAIHYGDESKLMIMPVERIAGDTKLW